MSVCNLESIGPFQRLISGVLNALLMPLPWYLFYWRLAFCLLAHSFFLYFLEQTSFLGGSQAAICGQADSYFNFFGRRLHYAHLEAVAQITQTHRLGRNVGVFPTEEGIVNREQEPFQLHLPFLIALARDFPHLMPRSHCFPRIFTLAMHCNG